MVNGTQIGVGVRVMVIINISVISWQSVLLVKETGESGGNHDLS
jgi:hypothetical protein